MHADSIRYLEVAGFHYKKAESPDLWTHLEGCFVGSSRIGPKFNAIPPTFIAEMIASGEDALLGSMVMQHLQTGKLEPITHVIDLPYVVGVGGAIPLVEADPTKVLELVDQPGTIHEHVIHVLVTAAEFIPCTNQVTVTGGPYSDGHTAGFYRLFPGTSVDDVEHASDASAYLATSEDIRAMAKDMAFKIEDITTVTREQCEAMMAKALKAVAG